MADVENPADPADEEVAAEASECSRQTVIFTLGCLSFAFGLVVMRQAVMFMQAYPQSWAVFLAAMFLLVVALLPFFLISALVDDAYCLDDDDNRPARILDSFLQSDRSLIQESLRRFAMCLARSVVRYAPYSYALALPSSLLWCAYGAKHDLVPLYLLSAGGAAIQVLYLVLFFSRAPADDDRRGWAVLLLLLGALVGAGGGAVVYFMEASRGVENGVYGWVCCAVASVVAASPLLNLPALEDMRQTRTMRRMPPWIVPALALLNSIPWTIRNIPGLPSTNSKVLLTTSGVTCASALIQLLLHVAFGLMGGRQPAAAAVAVAPEDELQVPLIVNVQQAPPPPLGNQEAAGGGDNNNNNNMQVNDNHEALPGANDDVHEPGLVGIIVHDPAAHQENDEGKADVEDIQQQQVDNSAGHQEEKSKDDVPIQVVAASASAPSTSETEQTTVPKDDVALKPTDHDTDGDPQAQQQPAAGGLAN